MDCYDDDPFHPSPFSLLSSSNVENLLEEGWFYGKVLATTKPPGMFRCYSDPGQRLLPDNPSCPSKEESKISKLNRQLSDLSSGEASRLKVRKQKNKLLRTPSLPSPCIAPEEEEESEITMSRLIREAMPLSSQLLPPRSLTLSSKSSYSIQKNRSAGYPNQRKLKKSLSVVESQELNHQREDIDKVKRRPPIPIWANKNNDMMKLQIKYWARAVASKAR